MGIRLRGWRVLGASVEGSGHRRASTGCQDSHAWTLVVPHTLVAAVADGAGSARLAAEGSRRAADFAIEYLSWRLSEEEDCATTADLLAETMGATRGFLERVAERAGHDVSDLATTLALVVADPEEVWAAQVGDGSVVVALSDGSLVSLAGAEREEYLNETTFLTSRSWNRACTIERAPGPAESVALLTDGLGLLALELQDGGRPHVPFFTPLLVYARSDDPRPDELERFLGSERVADRTDDDVTLLLATLT